MIDPPLAASLRPGHRPQQGVPVPLPRRILVVEDDQDLLPIVERIARSLDPSIVVDAVSDVSSARRRLCLQDYSLILSDYMLDSKGSGMALRWWCRQKGISVPFAMMSAFPIKDELDRRDTVRCPFLPKPFSVGQLRDFMRRLLEPAPGAGHRA